MGKQTLQINIPEPCHENWEEMTPTQCGAFCKACQKQVIDFTAKSEAEIVEILSTANGKVCGRIATDKLNRELVKYSPDAEWYSWKKWAIAAGVLLGINSVKGAEDNSPKPVDVVKADTITRPAIDSIIVGPEVKIITGRKVQHAVMGAFSSINISTDGYVKPDSITISGKVTDENGEPLGFAKIILKNSFIGAVTNETGDYSFKLSAADYLDKAIVIDAYYVGYLNQENPLILSANNTLNIQLEPMSIEQLYTVGGIMSLTPAQKIRGFFRRIGYAFHKHKNE